MESLDSLYFKLNLRDFPFKKMTPQLTFINNINDLAGQKTLFFFLIDFEKIKPLVLTPYEAKVQGLLFDK